MKAKLAITLGIFIGLGTTAAWADDTPWTHEGKPWTRSEILAIADQKAQQLGYDVELMAVSIDLSGSPAWNEQFKANRYWAVHYEPLKPVDGGDVWIIINRASGDILNVQHGE